MFYTFMYILIITLFIYSTVMGAVFFHVLEYYAIYVHDTQLNASKKQKLIISKKNTMKIFF